MSFDIVILKPSDMSVDDISEVNEVAPLGKTESVSKEFDQAFPGCLKGGFISNSGYSVELTLSGEPVESVHLTLRYGQSWSETSEASFIGLLSSVCRLLGGVAFAVSDNSRVAP